jgi:hypothetical protein
MVLVHVLWSFHKIKRVDLTKLSLCILETTWRASFSTFLPYCDVILIVRIYISFAAMTILVMGNLLGRYKSLLCFLILFFNLPSVQNTNSFFSLNTAAQ